MANCKWSRIKSTHKRKPPFDRQLPYAIHGSAGGDREEGPSFGFLAGRWGPRRQHPSRVPQCLGPGAGTGPGVGTGQGMNRQGLERAGQVQAGPRPGARVCSVCSRVSAQAWSAGDSVSASCWFQRPNLSCAGTGYISTRRLHYVVCELGECVGASKCPRWWLRVHSCLLRYSRLVGLTLRLRGAGQTSREACCHRARAAA